MNTATHRTGNETPTIATKESAELFKSVKGLDKIKLNHLPRKYNPAEFDKVSAERDKYRDAYEHVLWAYTEGICRTSPDRLELLMTVELPFHFQPAVFVDLEQFVIAILNERQGVYTPAVRQVA